MDKNDLLDEIENYAVDNFGKEFIPGKTYIPPTFPSLVPRDVRTMGEALLQFWYTDWKFCQKFVNELCKFVGRPYGVLTNSGSSASLVAMATMAEHFPGKYVVTCATGFPTTVSPIYQVGKIPIYIDIHPQNLQPDLDQLSQVMSVYGDEVAGVVIAHTLGFPFHEYNVRQIIGDNRFLISDCCDALGAYICDDIVDPEPMHVGLFSDAMTFSFFPAHHITTGEGGAVLFGKQEYDKTATSITNWGRSCYCRPGETNTCGQRFCWPERGELPEDWDHKYIFDRLGYNLKMTELQAALGYSQIRRFDKILFKRIENYDNITTHIVKKHIEYLETVDIPFWSRPSPFGVPILVQRNHMFQPSELIAWLEEHKVGTRRVFGGNLLKQPGFASKPFVSVGSMSGSDRVMNDMFWISCSPVLTEPHIHYMLDTIDEFMKDKE